MAGPIAVTRAPSDRPRRKVSVIVPGLNEERGIPALIERLRPVLESLGLDWEVIFVDDGSTDGTLPLLRELNRPRPPLQGHLAQPQLRQGARRGGGARLRDGRCRRADGRRPAASAGADQGVRGALAGRLRHRLRPAARPRHRRRSAPLVRARLLRRVREAERHVPAGGRGRLPPARPQGDRRHEPHARARAVQQGPLRLDGFSLRRRAVHGAPARDAAARAGGRASSCASRSTASPRFTTIPLRVWSYLGLIISAVRLLLCR